MDKNNLIKKEFDARVNSQLWNYQIANKVIKAKKIQHKKHLYYSGSIFSVCAVLLLVISFALNNNTQFEYDSLIAAQIDGTIVEVYGTEKYKDDLYNINTENETDQLIESTLVLR